jgi:hypothetical protein
MNGQSLPYVEDLGGGSQYEMLSDVWTLSDNGTAGGSFTTRSTERITSGVQVRTESRSGAGSYTRSGTGVAFQFSNGGSVLLGTIGGDKIRIDMVNITGLPIMVYQK